MCLGAFQHAYAQIYIFVCSVPCSYVLIYMLVAMPCASKHFHLLLCLFLMFCPLGRVQIQILWSRPTSIHLGLYQRIWIILLCMCVLVCFYALYPCLPIQIQALPCFCPPQVCTCRSLGPFACMVAFVPLVACLDVIVYETHLRDVGVLDAYLSSLHAVMLCLPCLLCSTYLAFFAFLHIFMLTYMFMHESVCHPYFNPMELWLSNPNLHPSILLVCFPSSCFFTCLLACFLCLCM